MIPPTKKSNNYDFWGACGNTEKWHRSYSWQMTLRLGLSEPPCEVSFLSTSWAFQCRPNPEEFSAQSNLGCKMIASGYVWAEGELSPVIIFAKRLPTFHKVNCQLSITLSQGAVWTFFGLTFWRHKTQMDRIFKSKHSVNVSFLCFDWGWVIYDNNMSEAT